MNAIEFIEWANTMYKGLPMQVYGNPLWIKFVYSDKITITFDLQKNV